MAVKSKPPAVLVIVDSTIRTIVILSSWEEELQNEKTKRRLMGI